MPRFASRNKTKCIATVILATVATAAMYATRHSRPTLFKISLEDTLRPRSHPILNPFRDRAPERICEIYLRALKAGRTEAIRPFVASENRVHILQRESQYRVLSWRIGDRDGSSNRMMVLYWVNRGGGYPPGEEEVLF